MTSPTQAKSTLSVRRGATRTSDAKQAVAEFAQAIQQDNMSLVLFFCAPDLDFAVMGPALRDAFPDVPVIGCTSSGHLGDETGYFHGGIAGASIASPRLTACPHLIDGLDEFTLEDGFKHAEAIRAQAKTAGREATREESFALLLVDALAGREEVLAMGLDMGLDGIKLVGGSAADESKVEATYVYYDGAFVQNAAVLTLVQTDHKFHVFKHEHFLPSDKKMVVTKADPALRTVYRINGRPAVEEYSRVLGVEVTAEDNAVLMSNPAVLRMGGEIFMRTPMAVGEDGSIRFACAIEEGVVLSTGTSRDMAACLREEFRSLRKVVGEPGFVLGFDCTGRVHEMETTNQVAALSEIYNANNALVWATYGEQLGSMHINQTLTGVAISDD